MPKQSEVKDNVRKLKDDSAEDRQKENEVLKIAYERIGGIPKNVSRTSVTKIGTKSYRVNIWTAQEGGIIPTQKIEHSLFLTL